MMTEFDAYPQTENEIDQRLLHAAQRLDQQALTEIHTRYYLPIYRYLAFRVSDSMLAEDLTSEVFVRLVSAIRTRQAPSNSLRGWLYRVASNVLNDHYRQNSRLKTVALEESLPGLAQAITDSFDLRFSLPALRLALQNLTEEQQQVIALRYGQGLKMSQIAQLLNKNEGAIKQLHVRALAALVRQLAPYKVT